MRIPFLVRDPRRFKKGLVVDEMILNIDLTPTYLELAGLPAHPQVHGESWAPLAAGEKPADWRTSVFAYYFKELGNTPTCVGVRTANAKLVHYHGKPEFTEAFDLAADPYEIRNLAGDPAFTAPLRVELNRLATQFDFPLPAEATLPAKP